MKQKILGSKNRKTRGDKKRKRRVAFIVAFGILIAVILVSSFLFNSMPLNQSFTSEPKAAIVDQLSLTVPNQAFIETATTILNQCGYTVDYYPSENVTVEFYRNLPTYGYELIILRVHSTARDLDWTEIPLILFTAERYKATKYVNEQLTGQLVSVAFSQNEAEEGVIYFGVRPPFVTQSMKGRFQNTIIIMMGCEGLDNPSMAKAFVEKGAKVYISWNRLVSASHTDLATTHLLQHFLIEKRTLKDAVESTMKEVGFDPAFKSLMAYYPPDVGEQTIENMRRKVPS